MFAVSLSLCLFLVSIAQSYKVPCYLDQTTESGPGTIGIDCEYRHKYCGYYAQNPPSVTVEHTIYANDDTNCGDDRANNNNYPPIRRGNLLIRYIYVSSFRCIVTN